MIAKLAREGILRCTGAIVLSIFVTLSVSAEAQISNQKFDFAIDENTLAAVLDAIVAQADVLVLYPPELANQTGMSPVYGRYSVNQALEIILGNTGLSGGLTERGVIVISRLESQKTKPPEIGMNKNKGLLGAIAAFLFSSSWQQSVAAEVPSDNENVERVVEEVIVTASKRQNGLSVQDLDLSISAIGKDDIEKRSLVGMQDYLPTVPGVNMLDWGTGNSAIIIRGMATAYFEASTTSTYLGEIPLGNPTDGNGTDIKLVDIDRVEVLRGPQGTLYGSGALSGAVRNIPTAPKMNKFEGGVKLNGSQISEASDMSYKAEGVLNIPLAQDTLALRVATYLHDNAGYVDYVSSDVKEGHAASSGASVAVSEDNGSTTYEGIRASLLWQPSDKLNFSFIVGNQKLEEDGNTGIIDPSQNGYVATLLNDEQSPEFRDSDVLYTNLTVNYDLGWATLTSSTSDTDDNLQSARNFSRFSTTPRLYTSENQSDWFTQELRIASQLDGKIQYVAGLFYEDFKTTRVSNGRWTSDPAFMPSRFGEDPDNLFNRDRVREYEQKAIFGELYYQFTDQLQLTLGARQFDYDRTDVDVTTGPLAGSDVDFSISEKDEIFKTSLAYKPNENAMIYAQWAQGFRLGKGQTTPSASVCDLDNDGLLDGSTVALNPGPIDSDRAENIELGVKLNFLDDRAVFNATAYQIDWTDLPIRIRPTVECSVEVNQGSAELTGFELETALKLTPQLQISFSGSYTDSKLVGDNSIGADGTRLIYAPLKNANLGIDYDFQLAGHDAFIRGDFGYVGTYKTDITGFRPESGGYTKLSLRGGVTFDQLSVELYGTNLTDEDALTSNFESFSSSTGPRGYGWGWRVPPRVIGMELNYKF